MKPGLKTTEFLITLLTIIGSVTAGLEGILNPKWAGMFATISGVAYTLSRAFIKSSSEIK